jgi:hypothetical protein
MCLISASRFFYGTHQKCRNERYLIGNRTQILPAPCRPKGYISTQGNKMPKAANIRIEDLELEGDVRLWDVMRAALQAKDSAPRACLLPAVLILKSNEIVARVYQSSEEPRTLLVSTCTGIRKIGLNWYDALLMLYRTAVLTLQKVEGTSVILFGERTAKEADRAMLYAMKWTARQFLQPLPRGAKFPETNDSISQPFFVENEKVCWLSEANTAFQFS